MAAKKPKRMKRSMKLWIKTLRSGEYQQGKQELRTPENEYCCLGVACDLYAKEFGKRWGKNKKGERTFMGNNAWLPMPVAEWLGLDLTQVEPENDAAPDGPKGVRPRVGGLYLDDLNDGGKSFDTIAGVIERSYS